MREISALIREFALVRHFGVFRPRRIPASSEIAEVPREDKEAFVLDLSGAREARRQRESLG
jgi:hypothetical protein